MCSRGSQGRHGNSCFPDFTRLRVYHRHRLPGVVHEQLFPRLMFLPHGGLTALPLSVVLAKTGCIRIRPGAPVDIPPTTGSGLPLCASTPGARNSSPAAEFLRLEVPLFGYKRASNCSAVTPSGSGQLSPAALACVAYSLTVLMDTPQLLAIARCGKPTSNFNRRISSIFRMDKLACDISSSSDRFRRGCPICSSLSSHLLPLFTW